MRNLIRARLRTHDEGGAVAVIVALCMIAVFAMVVLTVDVGGLLLERRSMVNAADAAALAAAQSCARTDDSEDPEEQSDIFAKDNVTDLPADGIQNIVEMPGCDTASGHVTVRYSEQHQLFFAAVLPGQDNVGTITTTATASWGPTGSGQAIPIVLEAGYLQGVCKVPDGIAIDEICAFWYNNTEITGAGNWGFLNLDQWGVDPGTDNCSNAGGAASRGGWIADGYPTMLSLNGTPPGTAPTYVCGSSGHATSNWQDLSQQEGQVKLFPVNDCAGQMDKGGNLAPCPATPEYYDIIGFTSLLVQHVYKGNDPLAIGSEGAGAACAHDFQPFDADGDSTTGQVINLDAFGTSPSNACFSTAPGDIDPTSLVITPLKNNLPAYVECAPAQTSGCHYTYDDATRNVTWTGTATRQTPTSDESDDDLKISFDWSNSDIQGACGVRASDPNALCVVTQWKGFTTNPGTVGGGTNFGVPSVTLCELEYAVGCPD